MATVIKRLIIHHSASLHGNVLWLDWLHKNRKPNPFRMVGYHWVIQNGRPHKDVEKGFAFLDGQIDVGRPINDDPLLDVDEVGAHAYGHNKDSLAICLIGNGRFTPKQFLALRSINNGLRDLGINTEVVGHNEVGPTECPGMDMKIVRTFLFLPLSQSLEYMVGDEMKGYLQYSIPSGRIY